MLINNNNVRSGQHFVLLDLEWLSKLESEWQGGMAERAPWKKTAFECENKVVDHDLHIDMFELVLWQTSWEINRWLDIQLQCKGNVWIRELYETYVLAYNWSSWKWWKIPTFNSEREDNLRRKPTSGQKSWQKPVHIMESEKVKRRVWWSVLNSAETSAVVTSGKCALRGWCESHQWL